MILHLTLLLAAQGDLASAPVATPSAQEPATEKTWTGNVQGGLTMVSGNNESTTGNLSATLARAWGAWAVDAYAGYTGVRTTDQATGDANTTARIITFGGGGKRFLDDTNNLYVYVKGGDRRDEPNGLIERVDLGGGGGYKFDLYENAWINAEAGAAWVSEELVGVAEKEETGVLRLAYNFEAPFLDNAKAYGKGEYLNGGEVEAFVSTTGVSVAISDKWSMFSELTLLYDGSPAPGFEDTDTIFTVGVSVSL